MIGVITLLARKNLSDNPHKELNGATWVSAGLTLVFGLVSTLVMFGGMDVSGIDFKLGAISPWIGAATGVIAGILIGFIAEYYTSYDYNPTKKIASASVEGAALTITQGLAVGMISCMAPLIVLGVSLYVSYLVSGMFGVAMAGAGMLSFVSATVSVDTYGPISDNAGGIAEMSKLEPAVREITDTLDSAATPRPPSARALRSLRLCGIPVADDFFLIPSTYDHAFAAVPDGFASLVGALVERRCRICFAHAH